MCETRESFEARRVSPSTSGTAPKQVARGPTNKREGAVLLGDASKCISTTAFLAR